MNKPTAPVIPIKNNLLVIDDEAKLCQSLSALFEKKGITVATANTAKAGLQQIQQHRPDVVLLDLKLPDSSGFVVLSRLREQFPDVRVVVISALGDERTIREAFQRGANAYLPKPFDFDQCFYAAMGLEMVDVTGVRAEPEALERVPEAIATEHQILPLRMEGKTLFLAMADPLDASRREALAGLLNCEIGPVAVTGGDLQVAIRRVYTSMAGRRHDAVATTSAAVAVPAEIIQLAEQLLHESYGRRATDLHLGMSATGPWLRERVDGEVRDVPLPPRLKMGYGQLVSHLKTLVRLEPGLAKRPQQGRVRLPMGDTVVELRLSVLPTGQGDHVAIHFSEPGRQLSLGQLGMTDDQRRQVDGLLKKGSGLLLITGPTRSGKSTTLYAMLAALNTGRTNIVTLEGVPERALPGVTQTPVTMSDNFGYAQAVEAALQHDPDILLVSELRDADASHMAARAALTGRLVLGGLYTPDGASTITRLLDCGIEPYVLCTTLNGIVSQRLVRRLCRVCREASALDVSELAAAGLEVPKDVAHGKVWRAKGCDKCQTGYDGRTAIFEILPVDHHIRSLIIKRAPGAQIRQSAVAKGMTTLTHAAWRAVLAGDTSVEELLRIAPADGK